MRGPDRDVAKSLQARAARGRDAADVPNLLFDLAAGRRGHTDTVGRCRGPGSVMTDAFLERRRAAATAAWNLDDGVVLVSAGDEIPVPGRSDRTYPFRAHSEYLYLADRERPGSVLAYAPADGWVEFVRPVTASELLWSGFEGDQEGVPEGTRPLKELEAWIGGRRVRRLGVTADPDVELRDALIHVRRPKDDRELERMRIAAEATGASFAELIPLIAPGRTERELQITLEAAFLRNGGDFLAFETIVAAGEHAAVLHFSPTLRELRGGDLLLVDAGAEYRGYASDVTRTYASGVRSALSSRSSTTRSGAPARGPSRPAGPAYSGTTSTARRRWWSRRA
jgi:hypothetical protein